MKKSNFGIYTGVLLVLIVVGLILFYSGAAEKKYNWDENLNSSSVEPYGTKIFTELLKDYFPTSEFQIVGPDMAALLSNPTGEHRNYFYVGNPPEYTDSLLQLLKQFVAAGNDAFFSINEIPTNFSDQVILQQIFNAPSYDSLTYLDENGDSTFSVETIDFYNEAAVGHYRTSSTQLNFVAESFREPGGYTFRILEKEALRDRRWSYFNSWFLNEVPSYTPIGTSQKQDQINMIQIPYGEGYFYIHLEPIVFSNYFQVQEDKLEYTSKILSYLKPGDILFDLNSNIPPPQEESEGPLKYILSQRSLRMAWYTLLASLFLFLVFRSKRVQQPIPVLEKNENKSLDFVQTIGRMYFLKQNHKQLLQQKMKLFLHFVQERYRIPVHQTDEQFIEKLHMKSEIPESHINTIFNRYHFINKSVNVSANELIEIHKLMDYFYKHCK